MILDNYHVGRSKVAHDELMFLLENDFSNLVGDALDAHLGLFVVSSDFGGWDHVALLRLKLLLGTTIEEERDMGVLLGLYGHG